MTDPAIAASVSVTPPVAPPLSQWQRLLYIFVAPSRTFTDIQRNSSWWLPFVLTALVGYGFAYTVQRQVGWAKVVETTIQLSPKQSDRIANMTADQAAAMRKGMAMSFQYISYTAPLLGLAVAALVAALLLATVNFVFAGQAKYGQMLAVYFYSTFPLNLKYLLATLVLFGVNPDQFRWQNSIGSNVGYYLSPDASPWWMALASQIDVFTLWGLVLFSMGAAIVGRVKGSQGYATIFGWWLVYTIILVAWTGVASAR